MSGTDSQKNIGSFDLANFISKNSELFVIMGVFGALAIYISQSTITTPTTDAELMVKTGFVSAFALSLLIYGLIYKKLIEEFGGWNALYRSHFRLENVPLAAFTLFSGLLVLSISFIITQNEPVVFLIIATGTLIASIGIVTRILYGVAHKVPRTPVWRISTIFSVSLSIFLVSRWVQTNVANEFEPATIQELSLADPLPVVVSILVLLVASIQSFAAIGVVGSIIGIPFVLYDKLRGQSPYDETNTK